MSVTVGFSQATTLLIAPAPGTARPDGTAADDGAEAAGGEVNLFAALLAMLTPGARPTPEADAQATADAPIAAAPDTLPPPADEPVAIAPETPALPELADLQKTDAGKALLKDFTAALKAAKSALDKGEPLDPALEKKLRETVDAIAAWFAGQPQLQPTPIDTSKLSELATGSTILPAAPSADLPAAPPPDDAAVETSAAAAPAEPTVKVMQAQLVPARLAELGDALKDFAAQLEKTSPDLARSLAALADRIGVGDIADDALAQLGLDRSPGSTSPELDDLVTALTTRPESKTTVATAASPIATPVLDVPEILAGQSAAAPASSEARKTEVPRPESPKAEAKADDTKKPDPLPRSSDIEIDTDVKLEARPAKASAKDDPVVTDSKPASAASSNTRPETPAPAAAPVAAAAQAAQAATTATRAIHAAYAAPVQQLNIPQVAFEVARQFEAGNTRFQIRLDPADLGRIDVKLDLDKQGTISAHMVVERPETLDLMMRDQRALQQALQHAGLDTSKTNLEFSLRQNPFAGTGADSGQNGGNGGQPGFGPYGTPVADESTELAAPTLYRGSASASGVNLFV